MTDFILLLIVGACWTWGVFTLFHEGYVLERFGNNLRIVNDKGELVGSWLSKPLFDCPPCMASIHGSIIYMMYSDVWIRNFYWGPYLRIEILTCLFYMACLCGLNFILKSILFPEYE